MLSTVFTALLAFSASALAYTTPTAFNVSTNPIFTPNSGDIVPAGKAYKITWGPTETGTVSIILLRGPSSNAVPLYPIIEKLPNTGSYIWTPKTDLTPDTSRYGLQLIIDSNGQYQYSTQFGISNPDFVSSSSVATTSAAATSTSAATSAEETTTSYETVVHTTRSYITSLITVTTSSISSYEALTTSTYVAPTYTPPASNYTVTSYSPSGTSKPVISTSLPPVPSQTGAASSIKVASGLLLGVAGVAAMLF
ncbi:hypothetical protein ABW20_dc0103955 [Dactylellina cionopaga]|nr:hypothetical protein ABW20_dc0103955 [Dactylellina cionopaga]